MNSVHLRILCFFLLTFALSWFGHLGNWVAPSNYWPLPMNPLGPLIAAIIVIWATEGWAGVNAWLRRLSILKAPLKIYLIALFLPVAIILASLGLVSMKGAVLQSLPPRGAIEFLILIPIVLVAGPAPEEVSFRGYGQDLLQTVYSPLSAAVWIGLGVVIWHIPLFALGHVPYPFIITLVAVSVVYAWLYQLGGSVWPLVILHFSVNYFGGKYFGMIITEPSSIIAYSWFFAAFYIFWVIFILWRCGPELGSKPC